MRNLVLRVFVGLVLVFAAGNRVAAQGLDPAAKRQVKARQKEEWKSLKLKEHYTKQMLRNQSLPRAERIQAKHEMQRERRELRQRQKDELQDWKDRQRSLKAVS